MKGLNDSQPHTQAVFASPGNKVLGTRDKIWKVDRNNTSRNCSQTNSVSRFYIRWRICTCNRSFGGLIRSIQRFNYTIVWEIFTLSINVIKLIDHRYSCLDLCQNLVSSCDLFVPCICFGFYSCFYLQLAWKYIDSVSKLLTIKLLTSVSNF